MKYLGNKTRIIEFIENSLYLSNIDINNKRVADLFAGTGSVSSFFLNHNCNVCSCDNMTYSIAEQYRINYFRSEPGFGELKREIAEESLDSVLTFLNGLNGFKGYFYDNYAPGGTAQRQYFTNENACKLDAVRSKIEEWKSLLPPEKYFFLNGILMCAADKVSNTSGTYGAYLKIWRSMALKDLSLERPPLIETGEMCIVRDDVVNFLQTHDKFDIIYLDPPYNERQYASNFHVLENIVVYDKQILSGKTGLREYESQKSLFCQKQQVLAEFKKLISLCKADTIVMSYSTEGLMKEEDIVATLCERGSVDIYRKKYRRFKTNSWTDENSGLEELLFVCKVY